MPVSINSISMKGLTLNNQDDLKTEGMHFVNVNNGITELQFTVEGVVESEPHLNDKYGYVNLAFQPEVKDHEQFYALQSLLNPEGPDYRKHLKSLGLTDADFKRVYAGTLKDIFYRNLLYLKLKASPKNSEKFGFFCNKPDFTPTNLDVVQAGERVRITVRPGLFFNNDTGLAGWFFSVKSILFEDVHQTNEKKNANIKRKGKTILN